jgi:hypothetical protein
MENGPFDSCGLMRFPFLFDFKNSPAHQRAHTDQPGITGSVITPATKPSIKREEACCTFPGLRGRHQAGMGGAGFLFNGWRAGLLQTLGMIAALGWPLRQAFCAPHRVRMWFLVNGRLVGANEHACDGRSSDHERSHQEACRQFWSGVRDLTKSRINCAAAL